LPAQTINTFRRFYSVNVFINGLNGARSVNSRQIIIGERKAPFPKPRSDNQGIGFDFDDLIVIVPQLKPDPHNSQHRSPPNKMLMFSRLWHCASSNLAMSMPLVGRMLLFGAKKHMGLLINCPPNNLSCTMRVTFAPKLCAVMAADNPAGPPRR
jgi:hypothetical protein